MQTNAFFDSCYVVIHFASQKTTSLLQDVSCRLGFTFHDNPNSPTFFNLWPFLKKVSEFHCLPMNLNIGERIILRDIQTDVILTFEWSLVIRVSELTSVSIGSWPPLSKQVVYASFHEDRVVSFTSTPLAEYSIEEHKFKSYNFSSFFLHWYIRFEVRFRNNLESNEN